MNMIKIGSLSLMFLIGSQPVLASNHQFKYTAALTGKDNSGRKRTNRPQSFIETWVQRDELKKRIVVVEENIEFIEDEVKGWLYIPGSIQFALPDKILTDDSSWKYKGGEYINHGVINLTLLGNEFAVHEISLNFKSCKNVCDERVFYYSEKHGLIGYKISNLSEGFRRVYWSKENQGINWSTR